MADQASGLRVLADRARRIPELEDSALVTTRKTARTIAVTSGKGGVGKTNVTANLALQLSQTGQKVVVLDADLGLANLHVVFGVSPQLNLEHVLRGEKSLPEILHPVADGIRIISGGCGITELANLEEARQRAFVDSLSELDSLADVVLIDTGAGLSRLVLGFVLAAEEVILVTTPEPTAIADAYATIKAVSRESPETPIRLVINMAASDREARAAAERLQLVSRQFLGLEIDVLGLIPMDPAVQRAVRSQRPIVAENPFCPAARALARIAQDLGFRSARSSGVGGFLRRVTRYFGSR